VFRRSVGVVPNGITKMTIKADSGTASEDHGKVAAL
jgi:hypothetical protein